MITAEQSIWARVLVTGSRTYRHRDYVRELLWDYLRYYGPLIIVHGDCDDGPDAYAKEWAIEHEIFGVAHDPVPVTKQEWETLGHAAGPRRNERMADHLAMLQKSDVTALCAAFIDPCTQLRCHRPRPHGSHGAAQCADYAESLGITTWRYETYERARI